MHDRGPMKRLRPILALWVMAFCLFGATSAEAMTLPPGFQDESVLEVNEPGYEGTTNFKFAPDGRIFVATKGGKILVYPPGAHKPSEATVFANLAKQTYDIGDMGLLGLALDPKFESGRPYVYALYSYNHELGAPAFLMPKYASVGTGVSAYEGDECPVENECLVSGRLARLTAEGNHAKEAGGEPEEKILLEGWCQQSSSHSIGDLGFGPEGALYVSGGEGAIFDNADYGQYGNECGDPPGTKGTDMPLNPDPVTGESAAEGGSLRAQSLLRPGAKDSANGQVLLSGTILRIDPDTGEGWPDNPEAASPNANARRIVGFGFRNPFRFVVSQRLGDIFVGNVGANVWEEMDRIPLGGPLWNSGWPCREGPWRDYEFEVLKLGVCEDIYDGTRHVDEPFFSYRHTEPVVPGEECTTANGSAISGQAFYEGSTYPAEYDNALFFADSVRGCIYVMLANGGGEPDPATVRPFLSAEISDYPGVDVEQGPDGSIYYTTLVDGQLNRISYDPTAVAARLKTVGNPWGNAPLSVTFDAGESTLPAGDTPKYEWDLDGDGAFDDGPDSATAQFEYTDGTKNVEAAVRVKDTETDNSSIAHLTVYPGDSPPQVTIAEPAPSLTWGVGDPIHFSGSAEAREQKGAVALPAASLNWEARLLHCPFGPTNCHEHPIQKFPGVAEGTVGAPDHSYPSYVRILLKATDARGLTAEAAVKLAARAVPLQIHSEPAGIEIGIGESKLTTPGEYTVIENSPTQVAAPEEATVGGVSYVFDHWSDGGTRVHDLPVDAPGAYTAIYKEVVPPTVALQIRSEPAGIEIGVGGTNVTTPDEVDAVKGAPTMLAAPEEATVGGVKYVFDSWSDGGAREHEVSPAVPGTFTAVYKEVAGPSNGGGDGGDGGNPGGGGGSVGGGGSGSGGGGGGGPTVGPPEPAPEKPKLMGRPPKQTRSTTAKFAFGAAAGGGFQCKLDRGRFSACHSPQIYRKLKPGRHTLRVVAIDAGGDRSAATVFSWKIVPAA
jgi:glucose/arabinose dehydrogenase